MLFAEQKQKFNKNETESKMENGKVHFCNVFYVR